MSAVQRAARPPIVWSERIAPPPRRNDEETEQRTVVKYLDRALPDRAFCFAVPNGGLRSKKVAARLSGQGVKAGVPDLCVVWKGRAFFIEMKAPAGRQSTAQRRTQEVLEYCECPVMVCHSAPEVEAQLREIGFPLRATFT